MRRLKHRAILVTGSHPEALAQAHAEARQRFAVVSPLLLAADTGFTSFFIPPSGALDDPALIRASDVAGFRFLLWLRAQALPLDWVVVQYGAPGTGTRIVAQAHGVPLTEKLPPKATVRPLLRLVSSTPKPTDPPD